MKKIKMNNVYIVISGFYYESSNILDVFSTFENAKEYLFKHMSDYEKEHMEKTETIENNLEYSNGIGFYKIQEWSVDE